MLLIVAYVFTTKVPASAADGGFEPPVVNTKVNAAPLLAKDPEAPNILVMVSTLEATEQVADALATPVGELMPHTDEDWSVRVIVVGNYIVILLLVGIACNGCNVTLYRVVLWMVESSTAVRVNEVTVPVVNMPCVMVMPLVLCAIL